MNPTTGKHKKLVSWKEADKAVLQLSFFILSNLSLNLRTLKGDVAGTYPTNDVFGFISSGYVSADPNQAWWSNIDSHDIIQMGYEDLYDNVQPIPPNSIGRPSGICWYSMQNLVRLRMREARADIVKALLKRNKNPRTSKQSSRNKVKRKAGTD